LIDLLSGAVGGVIVFILTALWSEVRDSRRRMRACSGHAWGRRDSCIPRFAPTLSRSRVLLRLGSMKRP